MAKAELTGVAHRMVAAHENAVEGLPTLLAGLYTAQQLQLDPSLVASLCELIIWTRLLYMPLYYVGRFNMLRTAVWATGFFAAVWMIALSVFPQELVPIVCGGVSA